MAGQDNRVFRSALVLAVACCVFAVAPPADADAFDLTVRSVVGIRFERSDDDASEGMGVYVGEGRILTAAHLFQEGSVGAPVVVVGVDGDGYYGVRLTGAIETLDRNHDAAVVRVSDPGALLPLSACAPPKAGDRVILTRLMQQGGSLVSAASPYVLEIEDRSFASVPDEREPVIPGAVEGGFSGGPALGGEGRCYYGIVSGSLAAIITYKDRMRRSERVVLIDPAAFRPRAAPNPPR